MIIIMIVITHILCANLMNFFDDLGDFKIVISL